MKCLSKFRPFAVVIIAMVALFSAPLASQTVRIKDIASVRGVRENQLVGIGIVTGLAGRGDSINSRMTREGLSNLLESFGVHIGQDEIRAKNSAIVAVTASIPAFALPGDRIDVDVSSVGDASDLGGGVLIQTNLQAANGRVYAVAQGMIASSDSDSSRATVGSIRNGAVVESPVGAQFFESDSVLLSLHEADFTSAAAVASAIQDRFPDTPVFARDAGLIEIELDEEKSADIVGFTSEIEQLVVTPDVPARVVIDQKSGVIVLGGNVRIAPVGISYREKDLRIRPASIYDTPGESTFMVDSGATVADFVLILRELGVETDIIIDMIRLIDKAGALFGVLTIE